MKRDSYIDLLRGILILLVIIGHTTADDENMILLFNVIYSFHMPFMIFISGYIEEENAEKYVDCKYRMILARVNSLLIPYFFWIVIDYIRNMADNLFEWQSFLDRLLGYSQSGLWFLAVLFGLKVTHGLFWHLKKKRYRGGMETIINIAILALIETILVLFAYLTKLPYLINMISYSIPYFLGVLMIKDDMIDCLTKNKGIIAFCMIVYVVGMHFFSFHNTEWITQFLRIILSCCIIVIAMNFKEQVRTDTSWMEKLCILGKNSMTVYLLHGMFIDYGPLLSTIDSSFIAGVLHVLLAVVVATVCVILGKALCGLPYVGRLLFGIRYSNRM